MWAEFIGDLVILFSAIFAVLGKDALSPGLVGLSLSFALQVVTTFYHILNMYWLLPTFSIHCNFAVVQDSEVFRKYRRLKVLV